MDKVDEKIFSKEICAIVVTWNPHVEIFIEVVKKYQEQFNIIIVDNGSEKCIKDSISSLESEYCKIISLEENKGIAFAINKGIEFSGNFDPKYFLFLDQDSIFPDKAIGILKQKIEDLFEAGVSLPIVGPLPIDERTGCGIGIYRNVEKSPAAMKYIEFETIYTSGMLVPKEIGIKFLQREDFFIDYVDTEWCFRVRSAGGRFFVVPRVRVKHKVGDSEMGLSFFRKQPLIIHKPVRQYYQLRNSIWMLRLDYIPFSRRLIIFIRCLLRVLLLALCVAPRNKRLYYILFGFFDGFFGVSRKWKR